MRVRIAFSDVDMHGNVHNARHVAYAEDAVTDLLRAAGLSDRFDPRSRTAVYHVKKVEVVFHRPLGFGDLIDVTARPARIGRTSLTFDVTARPAEHPDTSPAVRTQVVWVCVDPATRRTIPVPEETRTALAALGAGAGGAF
ncbi:acyl-CoA thioesterase [Marinitenerispora sediminis]|uniref:Acyl-CoA thioesterase n=1 Tax=Marinitenerispora sediminis TaxID=1931232 RepID=A0A368T2H4_9ACTN|nr:thioesterase family protein [Marinitenerispora sediminis]RCV49209.1 acyl-CoA thioesterase [Marinitenerispora sediminis]RCV51542.1 acyl-CoA thioesterase [Marinitenerispora sediminis]RCV55123.1 acyl-CoA thioesterase [Marinitenerispora sediminis]